MMLNLCAAYSAAAQTGRETPALAALLARSSPKAVVGAITAPTLLVQGERDTLFGLDQSDANARAIAAHDTTAALTWYNGGHDGGNPDQVTRDRISSWFGHYLSGRGAVPADYFTYSVNGPISDNGQARTRTLQVPAYPGLGGAAPTPVSQIALTGQAQTVINPPGGSPAGISSLPGLSDLAGTALANFAGGLPGQVARFESIPLENLTVITGTPRVSVTVSSIPLAQSATGGDTADEAVLFASLSKVTGGGVRTLAGNAVAPIRITGLPADGTPRTVQVDLPAVAFQVEAGSRLEVDLSTTDQAYAGPTSPAVYQVSLAPAGGAVAGTGVLSVPEVGGVRISAGDVPIATLIALIALAVLVVVALVLMGRVRRSPAETPTATTASTEALSAVAAPPAVLTPAPAPLEIAGLGKSYPGRGDGGGRRDLPGGDRPGPRPARGPTGRARRRRCGWSWG